MLKLAKGPELERRIESFFELNGYKTSRNVVVEGKSGARHEVDVLALKRDGVMDFKILVECKAWDHAITKEVVSKTSFVSTDLGIHKTLVVSLTGWTTGAEKAARELGVELWGPNDIRDRLGQVAVAELELGTTNRSGRGFTLVMQEDVAMELLRKRARGFIGIGQEEVAWVRQAWLPLLMLELGLTRERPRFLRGMVVETNLRWNLYEGITGTFLMSYENEPAMEEVAMGTTVAPLAKAGAIEREIHDAFTRANKVVTERARSRHNARLLGQGIPADVAGVTVNRTEVVYLPLYVALLRRGEGRRFVAVDGRWGQPWHAVDAALTAKAAYAVQAITGDQASLLEERPVPNELWRVAIVAMAVAGAEWLLFRENTGVLLTVWVVSAVLAVRLSTLGR